MRNKAKQLKQISMEIKQCEVCKIDKVGKAVPGEGNPDADIMFIGEAPGKTESLTGRPFVGRSGKLLRSLIKEAGLKEDDFFITSPVKYLPEKGTPTPSDIRHGKIHLDKQIEIIDPKIIVLLGSVAAQGVLGKKIPIVKDHGKTIVENLKKYFLTLHPAAVVRFAKFRPIIKKDFEKLKSLMNQN